MNEREEKGNLIVTCQAESLISSCSEEKPAGKKGLIISRSASPSTITKKGEDNKCAFRSNLTLSEQTSERREENKIGELVKHQTDFAVRS